MTTENKKYVSKAWICHEVWLGEPASYVDCNGRERGHLYLTKKDAQKAGWNAPKRVKVTVELI